MQRRDHPVVSALRCECALSAAINVFRRERRSRRCATSSFKTPSDAALPLHVAMMNEQMGIDGEGARGVIAPRMEG